MADDSILSVAPDTVAPADGAAAIDIPAPYPLPDTQAELVKEFGQGVNGDAGAISNGDLPWTPVLLPTTASGTGGSGVNKHNLVVGSWVFGIFLDPDDMQLPLILGTISGGPGASNQGPGSGAGAGGFANDGSNIPPTDLEGKANVEFAWKKLTSMGYTPAQAAGIIGNLMAESSTRLNPRSIGDGGRARGIAQWHPDRWGPLMQYAKAKGGDPWSVEIQLEYIKKELETTEGKAARLLANATTPEDAASAFCNFERPGGYDVKSGRFDGTKNVPSIGTRRAYARDVYKKFSSSPTTTAPTSAAPSGRRMMGV